MFSKVVSSTDTELSDLPDAAQTEDSRNFVLWGLSKRALVQTNSKNTAMQLQFVFALIYLTASLNFFHTKLQVAPF